MLPQVLDSLRRGHQVMVFVHSRKDTVKTGRALAEAAGKATLSLCYKSIQGLSCFAFVDMLLQTWS